MKTETVDTILVITLPERLDAAMLGQVESNFEAQVTKHGGKALVDMGGVNFVASLALRMLLTNLKKIQASGGDLRLCGLQPQIAEIFRKTRFDTLFKIYPDRSAALADY